MCKESLLFYWRFTIYYGGPGRVVFAVVNSEEGGRELCDRAFVFLFGEYIGTPGALRTSSRVKNM